MWMSEFLLNRLGWERYEKVISTLLSIGTILAFVASITFTMIFFTQEYTFLAYFMTFIDGFMLNTYIQMLRRIKNEQRDYCWHLQFGFGGTVNNVVKNDRIIMYALTVDQAKQLCLSKGLPSTIDYGYLHNDEKHIDFIRWLSRHVPHSKIKQTVSSCLRETEFQVIKSYMKFWANSNP